MKRPGLSLLLLLILFSVNVFCSEAQLWKIRRLEAVVGFGPSFFFGDVGGFSKGENALGFKDISFKQIRYNLNLNVRYRIVEDINVRLAFTSALLRASDQRGSNSGRALTSYTSILEPMAVGEYYFIKNTNENSFLFAKGKQKVFQNFMSSLDFYAFTGVGTVRYSVKLVEDPEMTGIQRKGLAVIIPVGVGSSMIFSPNFDFGIEIAGRYAFTDYLDGYSSQYSRSNDVYYFLNFTLTYKFKTDPGGLPTFRKK